MKEWIVSIGVIVVLTSIISLILPEGKIGNYIKGIFSILVILVIFKPISNVIKSNYNFENINSSNAIVLQDEYLHYVYENKVKSYKKTCTDIANNNGIENAETFIDYSVNENGKFIVDKIYLNLSNAVIISDKEHIYVIDEIKNQISYSLNVDTEVIMVID